MLREELEHMFFYLFHEKEQDDVSTCRRFSMYILFVFYQGDVHNSTEGDTKMRDVGVQFVWWSWMLDVANLSHDELVLEATIFVYDANEEDEILGMNILVYFIFFNVRKKTTWNM